MQANMERPPIAGQPLSIIFTVPPESTQTADALRDWVTYLNGLNNDYELFLVSESAEASAPVLNQTYARVRLLQTSAAGGFGAALRSGLAIAQHPLVFYARAAERFKPSDVTQFLQWIDRVDLVVGQRVLPSKFPRRRIREWCFRQMVRWISGVRVKDIECPFVLARRSIFARIPIQSSGTFAHVEVLAKANFLGCLMTEVSVAFRPAKPEQVSDLSSNMSALRQDARRVRRNPDFGPPFLPESEAAAPAAAVTPETSTDPSPAPQ